MTASCPETPHVIREAQALPPLTYWERLLAEIALGINRGRLAVRLHDGRWLAFGPGGAPDATLELNHPKVARRIVTAGDVGVAEAYLDGQCESPDWSAVVELVSINAEAMLARLEGRFWFRVARRVNHALRANHRQGSRRNIAAHYDLGNAFYRAWLDPTMTYSSGIFERPEDDLETAQANKYRRLIELLDPKPDDHLLEIGCGWGGFAIEAARQRGCRVTGITLSREQHDFACGRIQELGLNDRIDIRLEDYRDVEGRFDRIASIEMFEAVGERYWPLYFQRLTDLLAEGRPGRAAGHHHRRGPVRRLPEEPRLHSEARLPRRHAADRAGAAEALHRRRADLAAGKRLRAALCADPGRLARPVPGRLAGSDAARFR